MGKALISILGILIATASCGGGVPEDVDVPGVIAKLREQPVAAYRFDYRLETDVYYLHGLDPMPVQWEGTHVQSGDPWVSCYLMREYLIDDPNQTYFAKQEAGLHHGLTEFGWGGPEWSCNNQKYDRGPIGPLGFFPVVDGGLRSEAAALLEAFPPTSLSIEGGEVLMTWDSLPEDLMTILRRQHRAPLSPPDLILERMELRVDWNTGFPSSFHVHFPDEQGIRIAYLDPEFLQVSYREARDALREEIDVPLSVRCGDDGDIYNVMLQMPGWEERKWD